jgi:hypothetical protein
MFCENKTISENFVPDITKEKMSSEILGMDGCTVEKYGRFKIATHFFFI